MTEGQQARGTFVIRTFRPEDGEALIRLNAYGLQAAGIAADADHYAGEDIADLAGTYTPRVGGQLLVGELDGTVVAMGGIRRVDEETCELLRMRVYPEHQGRGYGRRILERLEAEAAELGYRRITLLTGENQHPAIDLYQSHGYEVDRQETLIGIASVHMSKHLAAAPTETPTTAAAGQ